MGAIGDNALSPFFRKWAKISSQFQCSGPGIPNPLMAAFTAIPSKPEMCWKHDRAYLKPETRVRRPEAYLYLKSYFGEHAWLSQQQL